MDAHSFGFLYCYFKSVLQLTSIRILPAENERGHLLPCGGIKFYLYSISCDSLVIII